MSTGTELSERFKQALQDLNEAAKSSGLAQDNTLKERIETFQALTGRTIKVGLEEDKLSSKEIQDHILDVLGPMAAESVEIQKESTIFDMISILTEYFKPGKIDKELHEATFEADQEKPKSKPLFPHNQVISNLIYNTIHDKYFQCTEQERRSIARSDEEFCMMIRSAITVLSGFADNEYEAFGDVLDLKIPRIARGNELLWDPRGDPLDLPEKVEGFDKVNERLDYLLKITFIEFSKLYSEIYKKVSEYYFTSENKNKGQAARLMLNTSYEVMMALPLLYHRCNEMDDFTEFDNLVLPMIIDTVIIQRLTKKNSFVNRHKRQLVRKNLLVKINEELDRSTT